jgi:2-keto-4-pentenoate hydratase
MDPPDAASPPRPSAVLAAEELLRQHRAGERFAALPSPWEIGDAAFAYAVQAELVGQLQSMRGTRACGYKIALTTPAMRRMVGFHDSISGRLLADRVVGSGAAIRAGDFGRLLIEFEIAFQLGSDLPARAEPWTRDDILSHVDCAFAALEVADDRNADYATLATSILTLAADNAWNEGLVLGPPVKGLTPPDLLAAIGVARIDGREAGRGTGSDVLGHPLDALAWLADHLQARGLGLRAGDLVTTGSLVTSKFPQAGNRVEFQVDGLGSVSLNVR